MPPAADGWGMLLGLTAIAGPIRVALLVSPSPPGFA